MLILRILLLTIFFMLNGMNDTNSLKISSGSIRRFHVQRIRNDLGLYLYHKKRTKWHNSFTAKWTYKVYNDLLFRPSSLLFFAIFFFFSLFLHIYNGVCDIRTTAFIPNMMTRRWKRRKWKKYARKRVILRNWNNGSGYLGHSTESERSEGKNHNRKTDEEQKKKYIT